MADTNKTFYILLGDYLDWARGSICVEPENIRYGGWEIEGYTIHEDEIQKIFPDGFETLTQLGDQPTECRNPDVKRFDYIFEPSQLVSVIISAKGSKARGPINEAATLLATGENTKYNSVWGPAVAVFKWQHIY